MYCYIYDDFVQDRKYEKELSAIENRITDLGLQGKIVRLALFRDPAETIRREVEQGAKTVVVIGNDATVHKVVDAVVDAGAVLGLIPVGEPTVLARILGIPDGVDACDALSQRIIEEIDVGRINGHRFITGVAFPKGKFRVRRGKEWEMTPDKRGSLEVRNLSVSVPRSKEDISNPTDALLDLVIETQTRGGWRPKIQTSRIALNTFDVYYEQPVTATADGAAVDGEVFHIDIEQTVLNTIVGRDRMFQTT